MVCTMASVPVRVLVGEEGDITGDKALELGTGQGLEGLGLV